MTRLDGRRFLIWSWEHNGWWRPNRAGYTRNIAEAGLYSFDEAAEITVGVRPPGDDIAVESHWGFNHGAPTKRTVWA